MRTSLSLLPAINNLYDLNLTPEDITDLSEKLPTFINSFNDQENKPQLSFDSDLKTLMYVVRRDNSVYHSLPTSSYRPHENIEIKRYYETDPTRIEKLDNLISDGGRGFLITVRDRYSDNIQVVINELTHDDLPNMAIIQRFLSESSTHKVFKDTYARTYKTLQEWINTLGPLIIEKYEKFHISDTDLTAKEIKQFLQLALPNAKKTETDKLLELRKSIRQADSSYLKVITDICEQDNIRFCVRHAMGGYGDPSIGLVPIHSDNISYDYADVNRFYLSSGSSYREDYSSEKPFGAAMFIDDNPILPKEHILKHMANTINEDETSHLTENDVKLIVKRLSQREARENAERKQQEALEKKVETKIKVLETPKGMIKLNNVLFYNNRIEYAGQTLSLGTRPNWVYNLVRRFTYNFKLNDINYDHVFDAFIDLASNGEDTKGQIGTVNFDLETKSTTNVRGITSTRFYINGCRINKDELNPSLNRAICFEKQEDFDYFLKSVSTCSLKMHRYLQTGIDIDVRDDFDGSNCVMKLPLERRKNLNYLVLNDHEYRIRDTHKVLGLQKKYHLLDVINVLLNTDICVGVEAEDIKDLIEAAKKEYITAVEKSKQLLQETEDLFKLKIDTLRFEDGKERTGYHIKGNIRDYFLEYTEREDARAGVYTFPAGKYICIVDKSTSQVGMDKIVNRIYALHNDSLVASQINTLQT